MARIAVVGLWHQGAVLCGCLPNLGHHVRGVDDTPGVIDGLRSGRPPVHEPGLPGLLRRHQGRGRLSFTADFAEGLGGADFVFLSIDTPVGPGDEPDLAPVMTLAARIGKQLPRRATATVVVTSQVPVGTCERIAGVIAQAGRAAGRVPVAHVPEFLQLGRAVRTFRRADRIVVGAPDRGTADRVATLYRGLRRPIVRTDLRTAEMSKHASNAFLAMSVSAINELADLCERVGADVVQVANIMKLDRRIGPQAYLSAGLGFAGGTLGRDVRALQALGRQVDRPTRLCDAVMAINADRIRLVARRLQEFYPSLEDRTVGVLGLTYKPGTSTLRRSIALEIIANLVRGGAKVRAYDPLACLDEADTLPPFARAADPYDAARGADALVLVTPWAGIEQLDLRRLAAAMRSPVFVDTRNQFDPAVLVRSGFAYAGVGRGSPRGPAVAAREHS